MSEENRLAADRPGRPEEQARGISCLANQRTLSQGYMMYATDNDSKICGGWATYDTDPVPSWVMPPLDAPAGSIVRMPTGPV